MQEKAVIGNSSGFRVRSLYGLESLTGKTAQFWYHSERAKARGVGLIGK